MRIKRGLAKTRKHKKVLEATKGYRMSYHRLFRRAHEAYMHAGTYSHAHRRARRGQMRNEWIKIISAGLSQTGVSYNKFIHGLHAKNIDLDRKVLAEIVQRSPEQFADLVKQATA